MHVKSDYNGAYLLCQIWNRALKEGEKLQIHTERLNVKYFFLIKKKYFI
jgi:hypothetical protein